MNSIHVIKYGTYRIIFMKKKYHRILLINKDIGTAILSIQNNMLEKIETFTLNNKQFSSSKSKNDKR